MITNVVNLNKERHWCSYHLKKCFKYSLLFQRLQDEKDRKAAVVLAEEVVSERGGFDSPSKSGGETRIFRFLVDFLSHAAPLGCGPCLIV